MPKYKNLSRRSNVDEYDHFDDIILVRFKDGSAYFYSYATSGKKRVQRMKQLADAGLGLNGYINRNKDVLHGEKHYEGSAWPGMRRKGGFVRLAGRVGSWLRGRRR